MRLSRRLAGAGTYRAEHPLDLEPSAYVGEAMCRSCHSDKVRTVEASGTLPPWFGEPSSGSYPTRTESSPTPTIRR